ncbi:MULTISPECIES: hypothetical protein [unclassified Rhodanobacter]|uniref:hypothetical protein n=1 Tax=unclassified Rhodanobacter TaxID=2621553 RepID=UPI0012901D4F|nr:MULTISPECIES: hypothetical protein [unclassified Rhodanobacter]
MNILDADDRIKPLSEMNEEEKAHLMKVVFMCFKQGKIPVSTYLMWKYSSQMTCEKDADLMEIKLLTDYSVGIDPLEHPELFPGTEGWTEKDFDNLRSKT